MVHRVAASVLRLIGILAAILTTGCDESFTPIAPTELQLSVFGYLDASADTQWIRVTPIRALLPTSPVPLRATVTLEDLGTGRVVELRDSLFRFAPHADVGSDGTYVTNFWTTEPLQPGAAYRFSAQREGERASEAVVEIPPRYEIEVWLRQRRTPELDLVRLVGLEHVAFVFLLRHYVDRCGPFVVRQPLPTATSDGAAKIVRIDPGPPDLRDCGDTPELQRRELLIVGSGAPWPSGVEYRTGRMGNVPSNVSNSLGFLGGVLTRLVLYETCEFDNEPFATDHCRLSYDDAAASLSGLITCGGEPMPRATVRLREIHRDADGRRKVRIATSTRTGAYEIAALEPGKSYALSVRSRQHDDLDPRYREHTDTLTFAPGERASYAVEMQGLVPC